MKNSIKSKESIQRLKIIKIASRLMSRKGYQGAALQEIANQAGIRKSTFYYYFKNKEALLLAVLKISVQEVATNLTHILENQNLSPQEKLNLAIVNHLNFIAKYKDNVNVYNNELRYLSPENKRKYIKDRKNYASSFEKIIDNLKKNEPGRFKNLDSKIVTLGILGMCNWPVKWFKKSGKYNINDIANIFYQMITPKNGVASSNLNGSKRNG